MQIVSFLPSQYSDEPALTPLEWYPRVTDRNNATILQEISDTFAFSYPAIPNLYGFLVLIKIAAYPFLYYLP